MPKKIPNKEVICNCKEFYEGYRESLMHAQGIAITHGWKYKGETMRYCAWCGKKLKEST